MANGADVLHLLLLSVIQVGAVEVRVETLTGEGGGPGGYSIEFGGAAPRKFVISQPTIPTLFVGIGNIERPGLWTHGWVVTEVAHDGPHLRSGILPGPRSAVVAAAEFAGVARLV